MMVRIRKGGQRQQQNKEWEKKRAQQKYTKTVNLIWLKFNSGNTPKKWKPNRRCRWWRRLPTIFDKTNNRFAWQIKIGNPIWYQTTTRNFIVTHQRNLPFRKSFNSIQFETYLELVITENISIKIYRQPVGRMVVGLVGWLLLVVALALVRQLFVCFYQVSYRTQ